MAYIDVLPLATMKTYLRIDDTQTETDAEITSMIKSALAYIEKQTSIMVYARDKDFTVVNNCVRVYDTPINSVVAPASVNDYDIEVRRLYNIYTLDDADVDTLTLNVGYTLETDVPTELIDVAKVMVKCMFYEQETNQTFKEMLPSWANSFIDTNRRFIF